MHEASFILSSTTGAFHLLEQIGQTIPEFQNFTFNQNYPARSVGSQISCMKEMGWGFNKTLGKKTFFIVKMTGPAMVLSACSDFWVSALRLGSFSIDDGDGSENVTFKMN